MSTGVARIMKVATAGLAAAAFLFAQQAAADNNGITRFAVRNCTDADVLICTYNKDDSFLTVPYDANKIQPSEKKRASCGSADRCKVFSLISFKDINKFSSLKQDASAAAAGAAGAAVGAAVGFMALTGAGPVTLAILGGAAVGAGGTIAIVKTFNAASDSKACDRALTDTKKAISEIADDQMRKAARDALDRKLEGSWPKYKNYSLVTKNGVPVLVQGDKC